MPLLLNTTDLISYEHFRHLGDGADEALLARLQALFAQINEGADARTNTNTKYSISVGDTFIGTLSTPDDEGWVAINLNAGEEYVIDLNGFGVNTGDTYLEIYDSNGSFVAFDDDGDSSLNSQLVFTTNSNGAYYINARSYNFASSGDYEIGVRSNGQGDVFTHDEIAEYLTDGFWSDLRGRGPRSFDVGPGDSLDVDITNLTAAGRNLARMALEAWTNVTGISFNFVNGGADITFDDKGSGAYSTSNMVGNTIISSHVNVPKGWLSYYGTSIDSYSFQTYIHEIGHALGLGHAGAYNGSATYGVDNHYLNDSWQATVMSYFSQEDNTFIDADFAYIVTPMIADIIAIQNLYDAPTNIRNGNTRYGENSTAGGYLDLLFGLAGPIAFTIFDTGGTDWLDLRSVTADQRIDLRHESISDVGGLVGNMSIARGTFIENLHSGSGDDSIQGNQTDNRILANGGADFVFGANGDDTIIGGGGSDMLRGGNDDDLLRGGAGFDSLFGETGRDLLQGGAGNDTLNGGAGDDRLLGQDNDDGLVGGGGNDLLRGGGGSDTLSGGPGNDTLRGEGGDDQLIGGDGNDVLRGGFGSDTLSGNRGDDTLLGGSGADRFGFGNNDDRDTIIDFQNDIDVIALNDNLWSGNLTASEVVDQFGSTVNGNAVLDFGGGDVLTIEGVTNLDILVDDIAIF